jgi:hypothetical protein
MVHVAHDGDYRGSRCRFANIFLLIDAVFEALVLFFFGRLQGSQLEAEFIGHGYHRIHVETLVNGYSDAQLQARSHDLVGANMQRFSQFADGGELVDVQNFLRSRLVGGLFALFTTLTVFPACPSLTDTTQGFTDTLLYGLRIDWLAPTLLAP